MSTLISKRPRDPGSELLGLEPELLLPSLGAGEDANAIEKSLDEIRQKWERPSISAAPKTHQYLKAKPIAEQLFDALSNAKVRVAQIAMHLEKDWRNRLFAQLDDLLDADDWHEDDKLLEGSSFATFLRIILFQKPQRRPGLGVSDQGNLIAAWTNGNDRLTLECLPGDMIRWVLSCDIDGEVERGAGETPVWRLPTVIGPYRPDRWFLDAKPATAAR